MQGVDISNWKPDFNPATVAYDFLVVQTTWGAGEVTNNGIVKSVWLGADAMIQAARKRGKLYGWMHYLRGVGAIAEARFAYEHNKGYIREGLSTIDWEADDNVAWGNGAYLDQFLAEFIRLSGVPPLVYTMADALSWVAPIARKHNCGLWVAQYGSMDPTGYQDKPWNEGAYDCVIRQYTSSGSLPGYNGRLDLDKAYINAEQWKQYANPGGKPVAAAPAKPAATPSKPVSAPAQKPSGNVQKYTVQSGDNLSAIAARFGVPVSAISGYRSGNPNVIYPGEVLTINGGSAKPAAKRTYTVQSGDNLSAIAARFGVPVSAISGYRSGNPNVIYPGEILTIN